MNIAELTIGQAREISALFSTQPSTVHPYKLGQAYLIETVTKYFTGRLMAVHANELVVTEVAWIADTGRYAEAVRTGNFSEIEPVLTDGPVIISRGSIVAVIEQPKLNLSQK